MIQCDRCGINLKEGEGYDFHGKVLCEDCYMYETNRRKPATPWQYLPHCRCENS